jgi:hypothetical protein
VSAIPTTHTTTASVTGKMTNMFPGTCEMCCGIYLHLANAQAQLGYVYSRNCRKLHSQFILRFSQIMSAH